MAPFSPKILTLNSFMLAFRVILLLAITVVHAQVSKANVPRQQQELNDFKAEWNSGITQSFFQELEQLSRIVDISYCVGGTGISYPFSCASRCSDFPTFELVDTFHSIPEGNCGYVALDHESNGTPGRILVVFRGTYSITDFILDLSALPQHYVSYPTHDGSQLIKSVLKFWRNILQKFPWHYESRYVRGQNGDKHSPIIECINCTVHLGFWTSYQSIRSQILSQVQSLSQRYPGYRLHLVGHSLGGAIAALAGLELDSRGFAPVVTTFGQPRVGNSGLRDYIDTVFNLPSDNNLNKKIISGRDSRYRRVTHINDPVPWLPLQKWGYRSHAGEIFIKKVGLRPNVTDVRLCFGDDDIHCTKNSVNDESLSDRTDILTAEFDYQDSVGVGRSDDLDTPPYQNFASQSTQFPIQTKIWQLFLAHRDYFWRLGLCIPGGDPIDWGKEKYL